MTEKRQATLAGLAQEGALFSDGDWVETKDQDPNGGVRLVQLADIGDGHFRDRSNRFLTDTKAMELGCTYLEPGDVLVARMPDPLGRACIFPGDSKPSVTAVDVCIVRPRSEKVDAKWLMWTVNSPQFRQRVAELQSGTTRRRISRKNLGIIPFPMPPLDQQKAIVEEIERQFTRLDAAGNSLDAVRSRLPVLRQHVVNFATSEGEPIPLVEVLGPHALFTDGDWVETKDQDPAGDVRLVQLADVGDGTFRDRSSRFLTSATAARLRCTYLEPGDLLIARMPEPLGRCCRFPGVGMPAVTAVDVCIIRPLYDGLDTQWLIYAINSSPCRAQILAMQSGTTRKRISRRNLATIKVAVPSLERQRETVPHIESLLTVIDSAALEIDHLRDRARSLRDRLLSDAFAGRLVRPCR